MTQIVIFTKAVEKLTVEMKLRAWKIAGKLLRVPYQMTCQLAMEKDAIHTLSVGIKRRKERLFTERVAAEIKDVLVGAGESHKILKSRKETAKENQSYVHYNV